MRSSRASSGLPSRRRRRLIGAEHLFGRRGDQPLRGRAPDDVGRRRRPGLPIAAIGTIAAVRIFSGGWRPATERTLSARRSRSIGGTCANALLGQGVDGTRPSASAAVGNGSAGVPQSTRRSRRKHRDTPARRRAPRRPRKSRFQRMTSGPLNAAAERPRAARWVSLKAVLVGHVAADERRAPGRAQGSAPAAPGCRRRRTHRSLGRVSAVKLEGARTVSASTRADRTRRGLEAPRGSRRARARAPRRRQTASASSSGCPRARSPAGPEPRPRLHPGQVAVLDDADKLTALVHDRHVADPCSGASRRTRRRRAGPGGPEDGRGRHRNSHRRARAVAPAAAGTRVRRSRIGRDPTPVVEIDDRGIGARLVIRRAIAPMLAAGYAAHRRGGSAWRLPDQALGRRLLRAKLATERRRATGGRRRPGPSSRASSAARASEPGRQPGQHRGIAECVAGAEQVEQLLLVGDVDAAGWMTRRNS